MARRNDVHLAERPWCRRLGCPSTCSPHRRRPFSPCSRKATSRASPGARARFEPTTAAAGMSAEFSDLDVDLVVMGVYGHSRLRGLVRRGVSRAMLAERTVPG